MPSRSSFVSRVALFLVCAGLPIAIASVAYEADGFWRMGDVFALFGIVFVEELFAAAFAWAVCLYAKKFQPAGSLHMARTALRIALIVGGIAAVGAFVSLLLSIAIGFN